MPIYILSRNPAPAWAAEWPAVHYVSNLKAATRDAKHAAGDKNVLVHGASIAQRALASGLLDEFEIHGPRPVRRWAAVVRGMGVYTSNDITRRGVDAIADEALSLLEEAHLAGFWIHCDLDAIDGSYCQRSIVPNPMDLTMWP